MRKILDWLRGVSTRRPVVVDTIVAIALWVVGVAGAKLNEAFLRPEDVFPVWLAVALMAGVTLPLAVRRVLPLTAMGVVAALFVVIRLVELPEGAVTSIALFLALFSAGAHGSPQRRRDLARGAVILVMFVALLTSLWLDADEAPVQLLWVNTFTIATNLFFFVAAWVLGDQMRIRAERERLLQQRTAELEREREENARRAVMEERVRIARELHDVVAHHVSVMGVQAAAARRVLAAQPERATEALTAIEGSSRSAVGELQRLLGLLRQDGDERSRAPQPGVRDLPTLVAEMRDAGLLVDMVVDGDGERLPPGVDLSLYRIVQEALTNTLRHAGPATASVEVRIDDHAVDVEVRDDGRGLAAIPSRVSAIPSRRSGHGLAGMRERVELLGGDLDAGPNPGGGFRVRARLPLGAAP